MILKKNKEKVKKVNKKALDKRNYFFFALVGVILIGILMILQTRFKEYFRLNNDGFAVVSNTVTEYLSINPNEEDVETLVTMQAFDALEYLYTQGGKYFLGDEKKVEVDTSYPVYMNQGAVLQLVEGTGVLYDENYERVETYQGLYVEGGYAYNVDGQKADPVKYVFLGMNNGNFVNFEPISYALKNEEFDINENSLVHFEADYFSYYEYEKGELVYKYCVSVNDSFKLKVGETQYTYDELLKLLGLRSEYVAFDGIEKDEDEEDDFTINEEVDTEEEDDATVEVETQKPKPQPVDPPSSPTPSTGKENTNTSPGVRPDDIVRPGTGSTDTDDKTEEVENYVQPQVTINSVTAKVYRIEIDATVYDPANRIDTTRFVRFVVYEVDKDGNEQLAMRSYRRGEGQDVTTLGGGAIKPETTYRIYGDYTYYDEYNDAQYVDLGSYEVTTGSFSDLTKITLTHKQGTSYHNRIEVVDFGYDATATDDELVYGVNPYGGIRFVVKNKTTGAEVTSRTLTAGEVSNFKYNKGVILNSLSTLKAKTEYKYEFEAEDYFGNKITLENATGDAMTSNHAPNATIIEKTNEIGKVVLTLNIDDIDAATVPSESIDDAATECDVYVILTKDDPVRLEEYDTFEKMEEAGVITAYKKLNMDDDDYTYEPYDDKTGTLTVENLDLEFKDLRLGEKFYVTVYADYDLSNQKGPQYFMPIGQSSFKTTDLNSLGKIYVTVDFDLDNLTYKSLPMLFHLNKEATSDQLEPLITGMKVDVVRNGGKGDDAIVDASFSFTENDMGADNVTRILDMFKNSAVQFDADNLQSMTEYQLKAVIYARYQDEEYDITPQLSNYAFKTLRKPAEVIVQDLLFAAGTLVFDAKVEDPDETIIGISGDKVVVQLYTREGEFVKTTRIEKGLDEFQTVTFDNLDPSQKYQIRFVAVEYNEGYTNASYESNKILKTVDVNESMSLDGTIKLQSIDAISDDSAHYEAIVKATLNDPDHYLTRHDAIPYYIKVEKDGVVVEDTAFDLSQEAESTVYEKRHTYVVDKGEHTYKLTMYVIVSGRMVELDTLTFTTETTVKGFSTAYEMISLLQSDSDGKFVATNSFVLNSNSWNFKDIVDPGDVGNMTSDEIKALGSTKSGANIVSIFNGKIDFQGFTLTHNYYADSQRMFTNIGSKGIIENIVYSVKNMNETRVHDDAAMCYRNFGTIRDIYVKYRGGYYLNNEYYGILTRVNSSTGVIENFVIENTPDEGYSGFSAYRYAGLVTYDNYGTIRYGYVYGDNIITTSIEQSLTREIGGIAGANRTLGSIYSVYSLLNVDEISRRKDSDYTYANYYGAVCGQSWGKLSNIYSTKDSFVVESKHSGTDGYQHSPIVGGRNNATNSNVYYYSTKTYEQAYRAKAYNVDINELYDVTWQKAMLTDNFDVSLVEVGYYPHVNWSSDLPEQKYFNLPSRDMGQKVDVSRATVLEYGTLKDGVTDCATVEFVFSNRDGVDIVGLEISDIDIELDLTTAKYEDGYTTIIGVVSNPRTFYSEYEIQSVKYYRNGGLSGNAVSYMLKADFYRKIYSTDDWYTYMVDRKNTDAFENVKLEADLDFQGIKADDIMVKHAFGRILDGNGHKIYNIDLQYGFNANNNTTFRRLFKGDVQYSGVVRNLFVENYKAGGEYFNSTKGKTYVSRAAGVFGTVYGLIENVHVKDVEITTYDYAGGLAAYLAASGELKDCSVTNLTLNYNDPDDANAESYIGGMVGRMNESRITHCYTQNVKITVDETKATFGIGGVVGYASNSVIDTAYAEGEIESRAQKVGGVIGHYYCTSASVACMKNMYAKVDIICYTDVAGGLVGQTNITQDRISATNNFSGVGLGNVYLANLDSLNCSQTIGTNLGKSATFYGTEEQLINGIAGVGYEGKEEYIRGLLSYDDLMNDAQNTYFNVVGFENVYNVDGAKDGYLPKMYYTDKSKGLLPNQTDLLLDELKDVDIEVTNVIHNDVNRLVTVELRNPNNYKITAINIKDLKYHFVDMTKGSAHYGDAVTIDKASDYDRGYTRIYLQYDEEKDQEYFLDSYVLNNISFYTVKDSGLDDSLIADQITANLRSIPIYSRINVMLCMDIPDVAAWQNIAIRENAGHIYENYRLTGPLDFSNRQPVTNLKLGRLISDNGERTISNVDISGTDMHLISRLNSGIKGVNFVNCDITSSTVGCIGIIGVSNGTIIDCDFKNITITPQTNNTDEVGIVGHSNGGTFTNITLKNITISAKKNSIDYVGGLLGKVQDGSSFENIGAMNISVTGTGNYVGGIVGATEMSEVTGVDLSDMTVDGKGNYTGGFCGQLGYNGNSRERIITNARITGTAVYDTDGIVTESTTTIKGNNYVGGFVGHTHQKVSNGYISSQTTPELFVDEIVVSGLQRLGGAFGGTYTNMYHITVQNTLVHTRDDIFKATSSYTSAGGVIGETNYSTTRAVIADNVVVDVINTNYVGGLVGLYRYASMQHCYAMNCYISADRDSKLAETTTLSDVGGLVGLYENTMRWNGAMNTIIDAPKHSNVGGVVGRLSQSLANNHNIDGCFYLANYDEAVEDEYFLNAANRYTAAAISDYYVKGYTNVGGIVGMQNSGYVYQSYSNANVIAADKQIAGGFVGMYCNEYSTSVSNGKTYITYAITGMYNNYFAGNVTATDGYAGGAIGRTGLLYKGLGTDANGEISLTGYNGNRIKGTNANCREVDKTYGNLIFADTIVGGQGKTGAFAADDTQFVFIGRDNRIWDKTIVNEGSGDTYAASVKKANGDFAYTYWNPDKDNIVAGFPSKTEELQVFESTDVDGSYVINDKYNRAGNFYSSIGWSLAYNKDEKDFVNRNTFWRVSVGDIPDGSGGTKGLGNKYEATVTKADTGTYLPQCRDSTTGAYKNDRNIKKQEIVGRLPLPRDKNAARLITTGSTYALRTLETTYGILYASDIDKINVEFSSDLVNAGYYVLKSGDNIIAKEVIKDRVTTFSYAFNENITFEYGFLKDATLAEDSILKGSNLDELESLLFGVNDIKTDIMVSGNDYYYISDKGLVSSVGTWAGNFVTLMNGKALDSDGNIWNVETKKKEGSVTQTVMQSKDSPLWTFKYGSLDIATYAKFSAIESEYDTINRNSQIFVINEQIFTVDGSLETRKTDILIYKLNGVQYQTVLGNDGMMVDMMQEDWNIPEDVDNQAIVRMSNTLDASVPYVLVEYNDGGIIGYNYATGELLFDNSIQKEVSLLQYAMNFFSGEKASQYANISNTYSANADLSEQIHSSADLEKIVGNSSGELVTDNSTGENTGSTVGEQAMADANNAQAGDGVQGSSDALNGQGSDEDTSSSSETSTEASDDEKKSEDVSENEYETDDLQEIETEEDSDRAETEGGDTDVQAETSGSEDATEGDETTEISETDETAADDKSTDDSETDDTAAENTNSGGNREPSDEKKEVGAGEYMAVYNNETGVYEIVCVAEYLTEDAYISENHKMGIKDLSKEVSSGYAVSKVDVNQERGIVMYIISILIIFGIAGAIVIYVKRKEHKA